MYKFSRKSKEKLDTCHPDLQKVLNEAIKHVDFTILEGLRSLERQQELVRSGASKTLNSKHLDQGQGMSLAVDIIAYPIQWDNYNRNYLFAGFIKGIAAGMGIKLRLGADWSGDFDTTDQSFHDLPHIELIR
jgi:peptidoglycan L-alanyl-D-glutamate endopeptidase CwlK